MAYLDLYNTLVAGVGMGGGFAGQSLIVGGGIVA